MPAYVEEKSESVRNDEEFTKLNEMVEEVMTSNGFLLNEKNSSDNETDDQFYDYVQAYEKDEVMCVATSDPDLGASSPEAPFSSLFNFSCFDNIALDEAYAEQIPFLKVLDAKNIVVSNIKINGDKATMGVAGRRTGAMMFMYKSGENWVPIIKGGLQAVPECGALEENNIPEEYWIDCYDKDGTIRKGAFSMEE